MESVKDVMYLDPGQEITTRVAFSPANTTARRNYELSDQRNESVFSALISDITICAEQPGTTFYVLLGGYMGASPDRPRLHRLHGPEGAEIPARGLLCKAFLTVSPDGGH